MTTRYALRALVDRHGGFVKIPNLLPLHIAEYLASSLEAIPLSRWRQVQVQGDGDPNLAAHNFRVLGREDAEASAVLRLLTLLEPGAEFTLSAGLYRGGAFHLAT